MSSPGRLAPDYATARERFLAAADAARAPVEHLVHPERGPSGEELAMDVAWTGRHDAPARVLVVSATHGIEGFAGSMCQSTWLEDDELREPPEGVAVVFLHALNPYGFAWQRRVDENNVDLNRNFVDFADPPANDDYDELAEALCPPSWSDEAVAEANAAIVSWATAHGWERLPGAISSGQYRHPDGIFYGGSEPVWAHRTLREWAVRSLADADRVALLDLHTGLGEWGDVELITWELPGSEGYERSVRWWGEKVASTEAGESVSARLTGEWMPAVQRWLAPVEVTGACLEWGTIDSIQVSTALRADNWLHQHGDPTGPDAELIKAQLRAAFAPSDADWAANVWRQFRHYLGRTLEALGEASD